MSNTTEMQQLRDLCERKVALESDIRTLTERLEKLQGQLGTVETSLIPDLMAQMQITEVSLGNGTRVTLQDTYGAGISEERGPEAYGWLRENGHAALIKTRIQCDYDRSQQKEVDRVTKLLAKNKVPFSQKDSIHHQTLKAWVREMCEAGEVFPHPLFGVFIGKRAKISL